METGTQAVVDFAKGDWAVHPAHGVGEITQIETRDVSGKPVAFYVLKIKESGGKVMVAVNSAGIVGLRRVMSANQAEEVFEILKADEVAVDVQPWAKRQRVYAEMLKSGSPFEVAKVLRDMSRLRGGKDLSFGERRLFDQARGMLMEELALARNMQREAIEQQIKEWTAA